MSVKNFLSVLFLMCGCYTAQYFNLGYLMDFIIFCFLSANFAKVEHLKNEVRRYRGQATGLSQKLESLGGSLVEIKHSVDSLNIFRMGKSH